MRLIKLTRSFFLFTSLAVTPLVFAKEVPVTDAYQDTSASSSSNTATSVSTAIAPVKLSAEQRITVLERQIANFKQQLSQVSELQQQVQELSGKLDTEQHNVKVLQEQVRSQYQDLDQRLSAPPPKKVVSNTASTTSDAADTQEGDSESTATAGDQTAYQAAFDLLKKKRYPQATIAFKKYIQRYPASQNNVNANYWLGQLYLLQGQPDKAVTQFNLILKKYPRNAKAPDTLLQLGLAYYAQGNLSQAKAQFTKVQQKYPGTVAAKSAHDRLQKIKATPSDASTDEPSADSAE